ILRGLLVGSRPLPMTLAPLMRLSGHSRSQETKWCSVSHLLMSYPASLTIVVAVMTSMESIRVRSVPVRRNNPSRKSNCGAFPLFFLRRPLRFSSGRGAPWLRSDRSQGAPLPEEKRKGRLKKKRGNAPQFDLREGLFRLTGTDLTRIDSIDVMTATTIVSEAGYDMSKWETEHHFVSWLRLCPDNRISGAKVIGKGRLPTNNPISIALKMAASSLRLSDTYLGAQFRRLRTRLGVPVAIKAMAAKLARLVYRMLRYGMKYVDKGVDFYQLQHRQLK